VFSLADGAFTVEVLLFDIRGDLLGVGRVEKP
jgi:hypothetical protein